MLGYFVWKITIIRQKIIFFPIAEGGAKIVGVFRVKNPDFTPKNVIFSNFRGGARRVRPPLDPPLLSDHLLFCWFVLEGACAYFVLPNNQAVSLSKLNRKYKKNLAIYTDMFLANCLADYTILCLHWICVLKLDRNSAKIQSGRTNANDITLLCNG